MSETDVPVGILAGDGIGSEVMSAALRVMEAAGARLCPRPLRWDPERPDQSLEDLGATAVLLKGPTAGGLPAGWSDTFGLYGSIRHAVRMPGIDAASDGPLDVVVIRDMAEGLFAGQQRNPDADTGEQTIRVTREGIQRIGKLAFDWARTTGRRQVTCVTKENRLGATDGLFRRVIADVAGDHPGVRAKHMLIDAAVTTLVSRPAAFDVIVAPDLYGDILGDVAAALAGPPGVASSARIGTDCAIFEPVHGPAPGLVGKCEANPTAMLFAAAKMLCHIGQPEIGDRIISGVMAAIEDGIHTPDLANPTTTRRRVTSKEFTHAVTMRLDRETAAKIEAKSARKKSKGVAA